MKKSNKKHEKIVTRRKRIDEQVREDSNKKKENR